MIVFDRHQERSTSYDHTKLIQPTTAKLWQNPELTDRMTNTQTEGLGAVSTD